LHIPNTSLPFAGSLKEEYVLTTNSEGSAQGIPNAHPLGLTEELLAETYDVLRRIASRHLGRQRQSATLNTTLIVHEAWLKLSHDSERRFADQDHYFATASRAMRQILVDHARRKLAEKRGAGATHVSIEDHQIPDVTAETQLLDIDTALAALAQKAPDLERIVECRFFAGLTVNETALALGRSVRSVERDWARARTYLAEYLGPQA
tara:strand:+ start:33897 stop:34517 length:621 start_codon:yes stop_codon:yes gene_type:complete